MAIYTLTEQIKQIDYFLDNPELEEGNKEYLEAVKKVLLEDIAGDAENIFKYIRETEAKIEAKKNEEKRLYDLRKAEENKIVRLKELIKESMNTLNEKKIETNIGYFSLRKKPLSIEIENEEEIPEEYMKATLTYKLDKTKVKEHLKETGEMIKGIKYIDNEESLIMK